MYYLHRHQCFLILNVEMQNTFEEFYTQENTIYKITHIPVIIGLGKCQR